MRRIPIMPELRQREAGVLPAAETMSPPGQRVPGFENELNGTAAFGICVSDVQEGHLIQGHAVGHSGRGGPKVSASAVVYCLSAEKLCSVPWVANPPPDLGLHSTD